MTHNTDFSFVRNFPSSFSGYAENRSTGDKLKLVVCGDDKKRVEEVRKTLASVFEKSGADALAVTRQEIADAQQGVVIHECRIFHP